MSSRRFNSKAFTLIELILVMVILAIITAIAVPTLGNFGRGRRLENASSQLLSVAKLAQNRAISECVVYRLNLDPNGRSYWITSQLPDGTFGYLQEENGQTYNLPDDITMSSNLAMQPDGMYAQFQPSGRTDAATIVLSENNSKDSTYIGSLSATERFHIFDDEERQAVQQ